MNWYILLSVILAGIGQIFLKKGSPNFSLNILLNPYIIGGLLIYGISALLWIKGLSKTPLNYAYPFTIITFIIVFLASKFIFQEQIPITRLISISLICLGLALTIWW